MTAACFGWWGPYHFAADTEYRKFYTNAVKWRFGLEIEAHPRYSYAVALSFGPVTLQVSLTRWWDGIPDSSSPNAPWRDLCPRDRTPMHETRFTASYPGQKILYCRSCDTDWARNY